MVAATAFHGVGMDKDPYSIGIEIRAYLDSDRGRANRSVSSVEKNAAKWGEWDSTS